MIRLLLIFCMIWCCSQGLFAQQEMGSPFIQSYMPADYNAGSQNWDIVQDNNGIIYVGNNKGLLQYDGRDWELIQVSNNSTVRSLAFHEGVVYVGAENELGYLKPTITGDLQYQTLLPFLDTAYHDFNITWNITGTLEGVFFRTSNFLLRWHQGQFKVWEPDERFSRSFYVNGKYYIQERNGPLKVVKGDTLVEMPNVEQIEKLRIQAMLPYEGNKTLMIANDKGAFIMDMTTCEFTPFESTVVNNFCKEGVIYDQAMLADGSFVLCTIGNGAIVFNKEGEITQRLSKTFGLFDEVMICLFEDKAGGLWTGLNTGIARIEINSPIRYWSDVQGLEGAVSDITHYNGKLYAATVQGLYEQEGHLFKEVPGIEEQTFQIMTYRSERESKLLIANYTGVYELKNGSIQKIIEENSSTVVALLQKRDQPSLVFVAGINALYILKDENGKWLQINKIENLPGESVALCEDGKHQIWLVTNKHRFLKLQFPNDDYTQTPSFDTYDETKGVPNTDFNQIYYVQNQVIGATEGGAIYYNEEKDRFEPYKKLGEAFAGTGNQVYSLSEGEGDDIWVASLLTSGIIGKVSYQDGEPKLMSAPFKRLPKAEMYGGYFDTKSNAFWLCADKLYRFEDKEQTRPQRPFTTLIRNVLINNDSTVFWGNYFKNGPNGQAILANSQPQSLIAKVSYEENSFTFEYTATSFDQEKQNLYSYRLDGHDKEGQWSSWTKDTKKQYTDLFENKYTFRVKAKNIYGEISEEATYSFEINPPWYRSLGAYLFYLVSAVLLVFIIVKLNARRILHENKRLENLVVKRTQEIQKKNEEIEAQNTVLLSQKNTIEKINNDTFDSIRYAERILDALHIDPKKFQAEIPDSFVFFKPRDIVSGDFFWFTKEDEKLIVAAIDCTGHGIPGAFMSVIGQSLLKETVSMYGITEVDEILHSLHSMLMASLEREEGASIEGMDMTICSIDPIARKVCFAGAKNPLVLIKNGELKVIKGDKMPVGGIRPDTARKFQKHTILLDTEPTTFYMFSDGFQDQFGGPKNRKFMPKKFRQLLFDIHHEDFDKQTKCLEDAFQKWKGNEKQLDDVLVVGFKL